MKIFVSVKPKAREDRVEKLDETRFSVWVKEPPIDGRANQAVRREVARYLGVPLTRIKIVSGFSSRQKIIEIKE